jgi:hypothetical protein
MASCGRLDSEQHTPKGFPKERSPWGVPKEHSPWGVLREGQCPLAGIISPNNGDNVLREGQSPPKTLPKGVPKEQGQCPLAGIISPKNRDNIAKDASAAEPEITKKHFGYGKGMVG